MVMWILNVQYLLRSQVAGLSYRPDSYMTLWEDKWLLAVRRDMRRSQSTFQSVQLSRDRKHMPPLCTKPSKTESMYPPHNPALVLVRLPCSLTTYPHTLSASRRLCTIHLHRRPRKRSYSSRFLIHLHRPRSPIRLNAPRSPVCLSSPIFTHKALECSWTTFHLRFVPILEALSLLLASSPNVQEEDDTDYDECTYTYGYTSYRARTQGGFFFI